MPMIFVLVVYATFIYAYDTRTLGVRCLEALRGHNHTSAHLV